MEIFSIIVSTIFILLLIALVVTIVKYPRDIFIELPSGILKIGKEQFLFYTSIITLPVWLPILLLDNHFKWGISNHKFFSLFNHKKVNIKDTDEIQDIEYAEIKRVDIQFSNFSKYFISTINNSKELVNCLKEGLESIGKQPAFFECKNSSGLKIVKADDLELYEFQYLIQWLDNELKNTKNYGFALNTHFSFFGIADSNTLNNIIGKTSRGEVFAFNLVNGQEDYLSQIDKLNFKSKYTTKFFEELIQKAGNST